MSFSCLLPSIVCVDNSTFGLIVAVLTWLFIFLWFFYNIFFVLGFHCFAMKCLGMVFFLWFLELLEYIYGLISYISFASLPAIISSSIASASCLPRCCLHIFFILLIICCVSGMVFALFYILLSLCVSFWISFFF